MKTRIILILCMNLILVSGIVSQNIINTFGTSGTFTIKDASTTYFTLNQADGTIRLSPTTANSQRGAILLGTERFLHTYRNSSNLGFNTFLGINSGNFTMGSGQSINASMNTGVGFESLFSLTFGYRNSAFGYQSMRTNTQVIENSAFGMQALFSNTTGSDNSAFGVFALSDNTTGSFNSAFGVSSLILNTSGTFNSAFGYSSLSSNTTGSNNSAFGNASLTINTTGLRNSAFGHFSLHVNTDGDDNSAFGHSSLLSNISGRGNSAYGYYSLRNSTGNNNTAIGDSSGRNITTGSNNIAIGFNTIVPTSTGSNQIRMGNTAITFAGIQVAWTVSSDRNLKSNIYNTDLGLGFINKLRPVSYTRINDESGNTEYGFIAQEVDEVLKNEQNIDNGIISVDSEGIYSLRYNDLLAPMVKAIQELKQENEELRSKIESMRTVEERLVMLEKIIQNNSDFKEVKLTEK